MRHLLIGIILNFILVGSLFANPVKLEHSTASLQLELNNDQPQNSAWVLLKLDLNPKWHTYWSNPGDSGLGMKIDWELPAGYQASQIIWQVPERIPFQGAMTYGYNNKAYYLTKLTAPTAFLQNFTIKAKASWLICEEICVPESVQLTLPVNLDTITPSADIRHALNIFDVPQHESISTTSAADIVSLPLPDNTNWRQTQDVYAFIEELGVVESSKPQQLVLIDSGAILQLPQGIASPHEPVSGFITWLENGTQHVMRMGDFFEDSTPTLSVTPVSFSLIWLLCMAFIGGIILNAMPCVFPVLSMKALGLLQKASDSYGRRFAHGLMYTVGVLCSFALVAGVLLALKSSGEAVGWGFQMQNPIFVALIAYLLFLVGLNLLGAFEFRVSVSTGTASHSLMGSFGTGVLATIVATPCTAPFMATALGIAVTLPTVNAMAVFLALGFGLAFPYLLLTTVPVLIKWLPKPGAWMQTFKQLLAFPMFLTVVWLLWVLQQQVDTNSYTLVLAGLVFLGFWVWLRTLEFKSAITRIITRVALVALVAYPVVHLSTCAYQPNTRAVAAMHSQTFDTQALEKLVSQNQPVFVYATAAWCITCKVNERVALNSQAVQQFWQNNNITVMRADWTNQDPEITKYLNQYGRDGVPIYVFYPPGKEPIILPQILLPSIVINTIQQEITS